MLEINWRYDACCYRSPDYRKELEHEYRKFLPNDVFDEAFIQYRCYGVDDDYIRNALERRQTAEDVAYWETL